MKRFAIVSLAIGIGLAGWPTGLQAQGGGGFGGAASFSSGASEYGFNGTWSSGGRPSVKSPDEALNFITVDGTAEIRVAPEEIRVVLAIASEAETADQCQQQNAERTAAVLDEWTKLGIPDEKIVEDFISVLPRYEWRLADRDGQQVRLQQRVGYRMQSNLHVAVPTEEDAMAAINRAFKQGVTDIVTFDYWSSQLNEQKDKARQAALFAAKRKAATLLEVFDRRPAVINVQESSAVFFPHTLYRTYENVLEEEGDFDYSDWRDKPRIKAYRPKMTFFHGLESQADVRPPNVVMRPEISVISTVRIYYQSPAEHSRTGNGD